LTEARFEKLARLGYLINDAPNSRQLALAIEAMIDAIDLA
jgi:hypothetical protein